MHNMIKNRKGFSLVELMIVVVIMGILIAVAIPLYGAITKNAERRTCQDNQRTIRTVYARAILNENTGDIGSVFQDGKTSFNSSTDNPNAVFISTFMEGFENGELPHCPVDGTYYTITTDGTDITVTCSESSHNA